MNVDPLAEKYFSHSTYSYCMSNPVYFFDPDGQKWASLQAKQEAGEMIALAKERKYQAEVRKRFAEMEAEIYTDVGDL